ncbi:glycerol-3-phosphate dehydrogenase [Planctomyces sp. SCGC AG-212-M04]|nr:glycerol-3-phosphate dehydrogenase [Planctomyces sp. SCGC AG-212-M04]
MGTLCSLVLSQRAGRRVALWGHRTANVEQIAKDRENRRLLPGVELPESLIVTGDIRKAVENVECIVAAIPSAFLRATLTDLAPHIPAGVPIVSVIKGIEATTFRRPSEIILEILGPRSIAVLSGPCHAEEAARGMPANLVAASSDLAWANRVRDEFSIKSFRVYTNFDVIGVELAGALKNVMAIAAGICDGLGYGDNAKSALITRGLVEMTRFVVAMGGDASTLMGLAGIGDLITTCISPHGRNRAVGQRLGHGETLTEITQSMPAVAEGVTTCGGVYAIAQSRGIDMPIASEVYEVLFNGKPAAQSARDLMHRPAGRE